MQWCSNDLSRVHANRIVQPRAFSQTFSIELVASIKIPLVCCPRAICIGLHADCALVATLQSEQRWHGSGLLTEVC
jgi:hypothetical protein